MSKGIGIIGTGSFLPDKILKNCDLEKIVDTSDEWITARTGIRERRIIDEGEATSDLAIEASKKALEDAKLDPEDVDLIIVATMTGDMITPSTACIVQDRLGCKNAAAFDLSAACSGFVYGISMAYGLISSGVYKNVLLIGAEAMSRILDWEDRGTCILFGDGAGAAVISEVPKGRGILGMELGSDGSGKDHLLIPAGGSRCPQSKETLENREQYLKMEGSEVFKFAVRKIDETCKSLLEKTNLKSSDIDLFIPHQANTRIINSAAKKLKIPKEKTFINLDKYGNMSAASIPVALDEALKQGRIEDGDNILLVGFGGGLTWGSSIIKWHGK